MDGSNFISCSGCYGLPEKDKALVLRISKNGHGFESGFCGVACVKEYIRNGVLSKQLNETSRGEAPVLK